MSSNVEDVVVQMPKNLLSDIEGLVGDDELDLNELIVEATKVYVKNQKEKHIRESMQQGYMEMAKINLNIASESFLAEEEAETTLERLVSGV
ncbi:CopG family transcriptional regulator / antitoxin EndoAI [Pelagirhabdus alkalitolerans]|uniref:CopG family transcriptional regulator / antitoxin EndoAI n=1 Tax=Pelagirhabdus alkalitolerans TaxID=1612202 RepID=A0A1G6JEY4_9BACI|nr:antitoxin [Pelagirhabdus alkalitolerans]SDC17217.1 CopG family transcriptional regulator / antitoxin EndoAI [Pelagirhabdus alkalitolerans]